jgi:plasmid stability protein
MKRTLIQFDEDTYGKLRERAFQEHRSLSSVVRELIAQGLEPRKKKKLVRVAQFRSVGAGKSRQGKLAPVSERHDEALAGIYGGFRKK